MQGASNFALASNYLGIHKPAILVLKEIKATDENSQHSFYHKMYNTFITNNEVATLVRKDIRATLTQSFPSAFSNTILRIQGESTHFHLANIYACDSQLKTSELQFLFNTFDKLVIAGDLNAKHKSILPHTQKTAYNSNGKQFHIFFDGLDGPFSIPEEVTVHNLTSPDVWTHITEYGSHSQIDYIISDSQISHLFVDTSYKEDLLSDHQGLAIRAPLLFPEFHTPSTSRCILDWNTFDTWNYNFITECEIDTAVINGRWQDQSIQTKVDVLIDIQHFALETATLYKQISNWGNTKPRWLVALIKKKEENTKWTKNFYL